jgi:hypothetical protein
MDEIKGLLNEMLSQEFNDNGVPSLYRLDIINPKEYTLKDEDFYDVNYYEAAPDKESYPILEKLINLETLVLTSSSYGKIDNGKLRNLIQVLPPSLDKLILSIPFNKKALTAFAGNSSTQRIRKLTLGDWWTNLKMNGEILRQLFECLPLLEELSITMMQNLSVKDIETIIPSFSKLSLLHFQKSNLKVELIDKLIDALSEDKIKELSLSSNNIGVEAISKLVCSGKLKNLKTLHLSATGMNDENLKVILESDLPQLETLGVSQNGLAQEDWPNIKECCFAHNLKKLSISAKKLPEEVNNTIVEMFPNLKDLS